MVFIYNVHELHCLENKVTVLITKVIPDAHSNTHTHTHTHTHTPLAQDPDGYDISGALIIEAVA